MKRLLYIVFLVSIFQSVKVFSQGINFETWTPAGNIPYTGGVCNVAFQLETGYGPYPPTAYLIEEYIRNHFSSVSTLPATLSAQVLEYNFPSGLVLITMNGPNYYPTAQTYRAPSGIYVTQEAISGGLWNYTVGGVAVVPANITLSGSQPGGVTYTLLKDGVATTTMTGNGQPLSFRDITAPGTYTIRAQYGSATKLMNGSVIVNPPKEIDVYNLTGDGGYPANLTLSGSQNDVRYELLRDNNAYRSLVGTGSQLVFKDITDYGIYKVVAKHENVSQVMAGSVNVGNPFINNNYIQTRTYTDPEGISYMGKIEYFDGMGRPEQIVQVKASPTSKDIITLIEYDAVGREYRQWLPGNTVATGTGEYNSVAIVKSLSQHLNGDTAPYLQTDYEPSPLNRPLSQTGPGAAWNTKPVTTQYLYNTESGVLSCGKYTASTDRTEATLSCTGIYAANLLRVTLTTDEDGRQTYTFTDKLDRTLLVRQINGNEYLDTYYIYDLWGNLRGVLPPEASLSFVSGTSTDTDTSLANYAYLYTYDTRNNCTGKKLPGNGWILYKYDAADRLILTQDAVMRTISDTRWTFTIPDKLGRPAVSGICNFSPTGSLSSVVYAVRNNGTDIYKGYTVYGLDAASDPTVLMVDYYDNYLFKGTNDIAGVDFLPENGYATTYRTMASGLHTGTLRAVLTDTSPNPTNYLYDVMYYNEKKQVIQTRSTNHLGGHTTLSTIYEFTGEPTKTLERHTTTSNLLGDTQETIYTYSNGMSKRLTEEMVKLNGTVTSVMAYTYDELGRLKTRQHGNSNAFIETIDYNVRGWLTGKTSDYMDLKLRYEAPLKTGTLPSFSGNITEWEWLHK